MAAFEVVCPHCEMGLDIPEELLGQTAACPCCSKEIKLPDAEPTAPPLAQPPSKTPAKAMRDCPYCGEEILAKAKKCKHCGEFLDAALRAEQQQAAAPPAAAQPPVSKKEYPSAETTEFTGHPAMFANRPLFFIICIFLIPAGLGLGLIILFFWWLNVMGTTLTITTRKTILRKGILSKHTNEVYHSDIRNVQVSQTLGQRMFGVGKIGISSAGQSGIEVQVSGLKNPVKLKEMIDGYRHG